MTVKQIVEKHLHEIGADGLYHPRCAWNCKLAECLMPCDDCNVDDCIPAVLRDGKMVRMEEKK